MRKSYKVVQILNGEWITITLTSKYAFKKWLRMGGHELTGINDNSQQREELQGEPRVKGLLGPMYDGVNPQGFPVIRYESQEAYDRLSA